MDPMGVMFKLELLKKNTSRHDVTPKRKDVQTLINNASGLNSRLIFGFYLGRTNRLRNANIPGTIPRGGSCRKTCEEQSEHR